MPESRLAVYFAPPAESPLWRFACAWLGRDAAAPETTLPVSADGFQEDEWRELVRFPRHYGFHATLKPPFPLRDGFTIKDVARAAESFAIRRHPFPLPPLRLTRLGRFLALTSDQSSAPLQALAADCVREFDSFRRPSSPEELEARAAGVRNARQLAFIEKWGYPYVFEEWQFHMTLTSSLSGEAVLLRAEQHLASLLAPVLQVPLAVDSICLFTQPDRESPFHLHSRHRFGA